MYLLPKENKATNKIIEQGYQHCDVFTENAMDNTKQQIDDFMRFVELHLNKLKRRKARVSKTFLLQHLLKILLRI